MEIQGVEVVSIDIDQYRGTVVLAADTRDKLDSPAVRNFVLQQAQAQGLSRAGLSGAPEIYAVGEDGQPLNPLKPSAVLQYRGTYRVAGGL